MTSDPGLAIPHHFRGSPGGSHCFSVLGGLTSPLLYLFYQEAHRVTGFGAWMGPWLSPGGHVAGDTGHPSRQENVIPTSALLCGTLDTYLQTWGNVSHYVLTFIFCPMLTNFSSLDFNYTYLRQSGIVPKAPEALFTFFQSLFVSLFFVMSNIYCSDFKVRPFLLPFQSAYKPI